MEGSAIRLRTTCGSRSVRSRRWPGIDLDIARRRVLLDARAVRLGQDHGAAPDRRLRAAHRRHASSSAGRGRHRPRAVRPRRQHGLPGLRALPAHDRRAERRVRPAGARGRARRSARRARREALGDGAARAASATAARTSSPAASASGSPSPAPSSTGPRCCCSTSRSARSTSSCARRCRSSSRRSSARSASPSSSSPTTRRRR